MIWRLVLFVTVGVAVALGAVGFVALEGDWSTPLNRDAAPFWLLGAFAVLAIGLASIPLLIGRQSLSD